MQDNYRHKGLRKKLIEILKEKGISDASVLKAMNKIPRHFFFDSAFVEYAYQDKAFPIASGQTISQPFTVAFQTQLLEINKTDKILEIGTGSGYQTAILSEICLKVFSIERQKLLYEQSKNMLPKLKYNPRLFYGDGYKGLPAFAPFNKILVTCGAPSIPEELKKQLTIGGRMVIPVGKSGSQTMTVIERISEAEYMTKEYGSFKFVPMLEKKE